ncbi:hypothetical protein PoB_000294700 [Plakobranchus ocellatus]|uniref:Uncharacterized protein n=1 Tax=Plakobranchus ocellatus TaxID=259542 RepID=A0AAV3Y109_9GAST|nr:hypothetical protein PoB_000294700 [Plakobranchus ocellatus]
MFEKVFKCLTGKAIVTLIRDVMIHLASNESISHKQQYMSHFPDTSRSAEDFQGLKPEEQPTQSASPPSISTKEAAEHQPEATPTGEEGGNPVEKGDRHSELGEEKEEAQVGSLSQSKSSKHGEEEDASDVMSSQVLPAVIGDTTSSSESAAPRRRLTTSNSGADIMLGLETEEGKTAEVEIDSLETDELQPEEIPKGRVRKTSIVEKLSKSKESELIALTIMASAGQRQREFEQLINEHQELVHEISRTPSAENIVQDDAGRDP